MLTSKCAFFEDNDISPIPLCFVQFAILDYDEEIIFDAGRLMIMDSIENIETALYESIANNPLYYLGMKYDITDKMVIESVSPIADDKLTMQDIDPISFSAFLNCWRARTGWKLGWAQFSFLDYFGTLKGFNADETPIYPPTCFVDWLVERLNDYYDGKSEDTKTEYFSLKELEKERTWSRGMVTKFLGKQCTKGFRDFDGLSLFVNLYSKDKVLAVENTLEFKVAQQKLINLREKRKSSQKSK